MSTPRLRTIPTTRRGRPRQTNSLATELIGSAGVAALEAHDLYIITGDILRELALVVGEAAPQKPDAPTGIAASQIQEITEHK